VPRRRIGRFLLEAAFLAGVAAIATVAELRPVGVIGLMAVSWVVVALFEWAAWLDEPHYGRGLPPRFYVPQVALPPPRPVPQPGEGYPLPREHDDAPTFVAPAAEWGAALEAWPVLDSSAIGEETEIAIHDEPLPEFPPEIEEPPAAVEAAAVEIGIGTPPEAGPEPVAADEPEPALVPEPDVVEPSMPRPSVDLPDVAAAGVLVRHRIDPLGPMRRRRLRWRAPRELAGTVEVPDRPPADRPLPSSAPGNRAGGR
jgi:hypothetical protein